ncbi:hypothetical protein CFAM422_007514 [Trichoderma lentiforme]|uniref:Uncharacterized protein n=1 Tax=Trichoderma lentiforme TaxID=1567552 RepID=A0A9P5CD09_9HYPO|nr:hypothetical protein CFAM422_007514 [Trichoderma lentiforme]
MQIQEQSSVKAFEICKNLQGIQIETLDVQGHRTSGWLSRTLDARTAAPKFDAEEDLKLAKHV